MKAKLRLLNYLNNKQIIDLSDFYCVTITRSSIQLQGHLEGPKAKKYSDLFGNGKWINENSWLKIETKNFDIILTI